MSYDVHTLTAIISTNSLLAIVHPQYHVTYLQGVDINHIFQTRDPYLYIIYKKLQAIYLMLYKRYTCKTAKIKKYKHEHVLAYTFNKCTKLQFIHALTAKCND